MKSYKPPLQKNRLRAAAAQSAEQRTGESAKKAVAIGARKAAARVHPSAAAKVERAKGAHILTSRSAARAARAAQRVIICTW